MTTKKKVISMGTGAETETVDNPKMEDTMKNFTRAIQYCLETGRPQQMQFDTPRGEVILVFAKVIK